MENFTDTTLARISTDSPDSSVSPDSPESRVTHDSPVSTDSLVSPDMFLVIKERSYLVRKAKEVKRSCGL